MILIVLSLPMFLFGFIFNLFPLVVPRIISSKIAKDKAFLSTFNFVTGLIVFPIFYFFSAGFILFLTGSWTFALVSFILMPFVGKAAFQLMVFYRKYAQKNKIPIYQEIKAKYNKKVDWVT